MAADVIKVTKLCYQIYEICAVLYQLSIGVIDFFLFLAIQNILSFENF